MRAFSANDERKRFGELLFEEGLVSSEDLERALETQKRTGELLGEILVEQGLISEWDIVRVIVKQYKLPYLPSTRYAVPKDVLSIFPPKFLHANLIVPLDVFGDVVVIALARNPSPELMQEIEQQYKVYPLVYVSTMTDVKTTLANHFPTPFSEFDGMLDDIKSKMKKVEPQWQVPND
jgi:type IV pilus assembly protein PilB